jgi:hypothetical protein
MTQVTVWTRTIRPEAWCRLREMAMAGGIDLRGSGKSRKKALDATINLVPFIDLMAVTIVFLITEQDPLSDAVASSLHTSVVWSYA